MSEQEDTRHEHESAKRNDPATYAPWVTTRGPIEGGFGTTHLPEDVVKQEFTLVVSMTTFPDNNRAGGCWYALRIGDRDNPKLTDDEQGYVRNVVATLLAALPGVSADEQAEILARQEADPVVN